MGRFTDQFIEIRRRQLEIYVMRVATHPDLSHSRFLKAFLESNEDTFVALKSQTAAAQSTGKNIIKWFGGAISAIVASEPKPKSADDLKFEEVRKYTTNLAGKVDNVHRHTSAMLTKQQEIGAGMSEFGMAFALLGQCEGGSLGKALDGLGKAGESIALLSSDNAKNEVIHLEDPLKDYKQILQTVEATFVTRDAKVAAYHEAVTAVASAKANHDKLLSTPGKEAKVKAAADDLVRAETHLTECTTEMQLVNQRITKELDRFKAQKLMDFKTITLEYVKRQIEHSKKVEAAWKSLLPDLEAVVNDGPDHMSYVPPPVSDLPAGEGPATAPAVYPPLPPKSS